MTTTPVNNGQRFKGEKEGNSSAILDRMNRIYMIFFHPAYPVNPV